MSAAPMPAKALHIAHGFYLPLEAVTQAIGILAKRRAGKSYAARRITEQFAHSHLQVVIIDPKGDWWGIRSSADGKSPGLPITILGGAHGDLPLEVGAGEVVAKLVVYERASVLMDLSHFRKNEVARFMSEFLESFYRLKAQEEYRSPVMLVVDEADAIAPQKPFKGEERMLGAIEDIVRRGGQRGIGCLLITQRSAVLNKNVLTQIQVLVAMRTIAPQDLAAMNAWIDVHGTVEQRNILMESLPSLPVGDAWLWSPGWPTEEGIFKRVHILPIETFDSGATPKPGEKRVEPKNLADVDLDTLRRQMAETIERAKADDPRELRKQIADLKKQVAHPPVHKDETLPADRIQKEFEKGVQAERRRIRQELAPQVQDIASLHGRIVRAFEGNPLAAIGMSLDKMGELLNKVAPLPSQAAAPSPRPLLQAARAVPAPARASRKEVDPGAKITGPEQRILDAIAWMESIGIEAPEQTAVAFLAGYTYGGGAFNNPRGALRTKDLVEYVGSDRIRLTDAGRAIATFPDSALTAEELQMKVLERLPGPERKILSVLIGAYPGSMSNEECAAAAGYAPNGGAYNNPRGRLRTLGLIDYPDRGQVRALPLLFLER